MNVYCVVYYPQIDTSSIDTIREKYDPYSNLVRPHITLVFPVPDKEISEGDLELHVRMVVSRQSPFSVRMNRLTKSWDNWLFLEVDEEEGKKELNQMHDELYSGVLASQLRKDIPYSPHVGLGLFNMPGSSYQVENPSRVQLDEKRFNIAKEEAESLGLDYSAIVDRVSLIKIEVGDKGLTNIISSKDFPLSTK